MTTKTLTLGIGILAAALTARGEPVYSYDGPLTVTKPVDLPDYPAEPGGAARMRLSFEAREYDPEGERPSGFWTFYATNAKGERIQVYCPGAGLHYLVTSASGRTLVGDSGGGSSPDVRIPYGADPSAYGWTKYEFESTADDFIAKVDGTKNLGVDYALAPFSNLSFSVYRRTAEIRNVRLETLPEPVIVRIPEPTLREDGAVAAGTRDVDSPVSAAVGGIMFWAKFVPGSDCVRLLGADGTVKARFYCFGDYRIQADVKLAGTTDKLVYKRRLFDESKRSPDDFHYAFTWDEKGRVRFFLNGVPFSVGAGGDDYDFSISGNDLDGVTQVVVPSDTHRLEGERQQLRDLRIYHRALENHEVTEAFRARMPVDLAFHDSVVRAGETDELRLTLAPGGTYTQPSPTDGASNVTATVSVGLRLQRVVASGSYENVTERSFAGVCVDRPVELAVDGLNLVRGNYRALVTVAAPGEEPCVRTKFFTALPPAPLPSETPSAASWRKAQLLWSREFRVPADMPYSNCAATAVSAACGDYLECGGTGGLSGDRLGVLVDFPPESLGHPCLLEIRWPDDKPRMMGFCMFLKSTAQQLRDRLMAGIVAGDQIRSTGEMQTSSYLFYPSADSHLFELRTQTDGRPAAIESLRVWRLAEPLPVLKVRHPKGYPHRRFGHVDEDQTFYFLLNDQYVKGMDGVTGALAEYFGYTGQSTFDYTIYRYNSSVAPKDLDNPYTGFAGSEGQLPYVLREFARAGIEFCGTMGLYGEPHVVRMNRIEGDYWGMGFVSCDVDGYSTGSSFAGDHVANMANPGLQDRFFAYCEGLLAESAKRGLGTLRVPVTMLGSWVDAEHGFDAWTQARFRAETGAEKPEGEAWLKWRAQEVTKYFTRLVQWAKRVAPQVEVRLILPSGGGTTCADRGLDLAALAAVPGATVGFGRAYTQCWWDMYRNGSGAEKTAAAKAAAVAQARLDYTALYDENLPVIAAIRASGKPVAECGSAAAYFETFRDSLLPETYASYFQSLDVKPWGRNFLREPAFMVGMLDTLRYTVGNQPLGTLGHEEETREFVRAYSALPAVPFADSASDAPGVAGRSLVTAEGTYFYLVNMTDSNRVIRVVGPDLGELPAVEDLSTGETTYGSVFALKPYELRSFFVRERFPISRIRDADARDIGENAISFGLADGAAGFDFTNEVVRATVTGVLDAFRGGDYAIKLLVKDDAGAVVATVSRTLGAAGEYAFDTAEALSSAIRPDRSYACELVLVNAAGEELPLAQRGSAAFRTANSAEWFAVDAAADEARGGEWRVKPAWTDGAYDVKWNAEGVFAATEEGANFVSASARTVFTGGLADDHLAAELARVKAEGAMSALGVRENEDGSLSWVGLVRDGTGEAVFRELFGQRAVAGRAYVIIQEIDRTGPRVSYLVESERGRVRLQDANGEMWFAGGRASGSVREAVCRGNWTLGDLVGGRSDASVAEVDGVGYPTLDAALRAANGREVKLLTNATWVPSVKGRWPLSAEGFALRLYVPAGWRVTFKDGVLTSAGGGFCVLIQ